MTEHEALTKIQELIYSYFGCDPMYYPNSATASLCCRINEIISMAEETK